MARRDSRLIVDSKRDEGEVKSRAPSMTLLAPVVGSGGLKGSLVDAAKLNRDKLPDPHIDTST
ncbi:hypothetical protein IFM46972_00907 [Aspergillus udagawae]|uniref:Uncharacterized protein n=1 Tax=Aspergillus udagawae TaxID=91492 RepID=A0A8H3N8J7_9EURO|nr:hypothetical protein IFM46972_00907 [Aspergillus udagawae]